MGLSNEAVQQTLLGDAAEHADVGILVWNEERRYVAANARACELVGVSREQLLAGRVGGTNRSPETGAVVDEILRHVPSRGGMTIDRPDGTSVDVEWVVFSTSLAGLPHVVGVFWDRTELKA